MQGRLRIVIPAEAVENHPKPIVIPAEAGIHAPAHNLRTQPDLGSRPNDGRQRRTTTKTGSMKKHD